MDDRMKCCMKAFGLELKSLIKDHCDSIEEFAYSIELESPRQVYNWLNGSVKIETTSLIAIKAKYPMFSCDKVFALQG